MIQLLHLSDVHLNAGYANKNENVRHKLREGLNKAVIHAIDFAINQKIEGIIIAGDFFDHDKISFKDEMFVLQNFTRLLENGQKIFYVSGNHDPMNTASFLEPLRKHINFYLCDDDEIKIINLISREGESYKIVAVGHKSKNEQRNLIKNFPVKSRNEIVIGIGHASVPSALTTAEKESYMAVALNQIEILQYDYFALGHIHIRQRLTEKIAYSGNIQGLNIKEVGPKGGILVTLESGVTHLEEVNFNTLEWVQFDMIISQELATLHDFQESLINRVAEVVDRSNHAANQLLVRVHLEGKTHLKKQFEDSNDIAYLLEMVKEKTGILSIELKHERLRSVVDIDVFMKERTVLSQMLTRIKESEYETELLNKIFELPIFPTKLDSEEKKLYLKQLSENLIEDVVERMVVNRNDY